MCLSVHKSNPYSQTSFYRNPGSSYSYQCQTQNLFSHFKLKSQTKSKRKSQYNYKSQIKTPKLKRYHSTIIFKQPQHQKMKSQLIKDSQIEHQCLLNCCSYQKILNPNIQKLNGIQERSLSSPIDLQDSLSQLLEIKDNLGSTIPDVVTSKMMASRNQNISKYLSDFQDRGSPTFWRDMSSGNKKSKQSSQNSSCFEQSNSRKFKQSLETSQENKESFVSRELSVFYKINEEYYPQATFKNREDKKTKRSNKRILESDWSSEVSEIQFKPQPIICKCFETDSSA